MASQTIEAHPLPPANGAMPNETQRANRPLPPRIGEARRLLMNLFSENPGRREASKRSTRLAIRLAAFELFDREGIDHVTVEQIATKADISPRTFFNYFATKEECVVFPYQLMAPALRMYVAVQPPELRPMDAMEDALAVLISDILSLTEVAAAIRFGVNLHRSAPSLAMADSSHKQYWEMEAHAELVDRGCEAFYAQIFAVAAVGIFRTSLVAWARSGPDVAVAQLVREGFRGLQDAFQPEGTDAVPSA